MRPFVVLLLAAVAASAGDFYTGQAARLVIGQPTFVAQDDGASDILLGGVGGLAFVNNTLFVTDSNRVGASPMNHRVLVFKNMSQQLPAPTDLLTQGERCNVCKGRADIVLGQDDFQSVELDLKPNRFRVPTAVASDGNIVAVADTDNNRVLIWNSIPTSNGQAPNVVLGQDGFTSNGISRTPTNKSLRGPQGVWIQNGKLFVADTQAHRVLIWNKIPTANGTAADVVVGQPNFTTAFEQDLTRQPANPSASTLLNPASVTSDGTRLYVADLGHNRVMIWNTIPTSNGAPADVVIGQPDFTTAVANYSEKLCESNGTDEETGDLLYPARCARTLDFPRYALSDGKRLFVADGGNDRVLIFNSVPTTNAPSPDVILGQFDPQGNQVSDSANELFRAATDVIRTPISLAWDGSTNLYVTDTFNRRVLVFSVGDLQLPYSAVRNSASRNVHAVGTVSFSGEITEDDKLTITISRASDDIETKYEYKVKEDDDLEKIVDEFISLINAGDGDPLVLATPNKVLLQVVLTAREPNEPGNNVELVTKVSTDATMALTASGSTLTGGMDAAKIAPGTIVSILGDGMSDETAVAPAGATNLPTELAGVRVYVDGMLAPLLYVSPGQINAQIPWETYFETTSVSVYVRTERNDGRVTVTTPTGVPIIAQNPGIFAEEGDDPRPGVVLHGSSYATGTISVDGSVTPGEVGTITIEDRKYSYVPQAGDTLEKVRDAYINLLSFDPRVIAYKAGVFTRIRLRARIPGPEGNGIKYTASGSDSGSVILTATTSELCCASRAYSRVTPENPALPGETIVVYATGLGLVLPEEINTDFVTGGPYTGPLYNEPFEFVSSLAGAKTANVLYAGLKPGTIGLYEVHLELNSDIPTNPKTQLTIAQDVYVSNIISFPVVNPKPAN
jgi:hypothetical protein